MSEPTASNQYRPETTDDQARGERKPSPKSGRDGAAVSPRDTDSDTVRETPEGPGDRPGTEAEAEAQQR
ncbi:hypothetical protein [Methylobacterium sp. J-090]|uniref:hypothetical protein n=1 Tax=Methylobacterium sp. J-090 TaxID=2836666 RepID=UPI001FBA2631|nr:hypothetical protein [Methylobacterium sp. J-090]MCJ2081846.1 hypothetical protein [Methylobacterium sp. J-090]